MKGPKLLLFLMFPLLVSCGNNEGDIQPNILWLTFEDTSPQFIGCYGDEAAHTPVMDELAAEGIRFTSAFSTGTVCSPSRFALITGCRTTRFSTGHHRSRYAIPDSIEAFPKYLRDAGYYTSNNSKKDYNTSREKYFVETGWNESSNEAGWWKRKPGQPFFAVFNSFHSHQSRTMTNPYWKYEEQILDSLQPEDIIGINDFEVPPIFNDSPEMRKELSRIYNSIQLTDQHFGEILEHLDRDGLADSTIVFCFSDHGEGMPWGKTYSRGMGYRVPFIIYFPDMYKHLSPWGCNVITEEVVDFVDLPATVLSLAGIEVPKYMDGRALLGSYSEEPKEYTIGGLDRTGENTSLCRSISDGAYIYTKNFMPFQSEKRWQKYFDFSQISHLIRSDYKRGKLNKSQSSLLERNGSETLYNLRDDPWEINSLIDDEKLESETNQFRQFLKEDLIRNRDAHFIPEYCFAGSEKTPFEMSRDTAFYPVEEVIDAAFLCGEEDALHGHLDGLKHENNLVRYWSAVGVYSHFALYGVGDMNVELTEVSFPPSKVFLEAAKAQYFDDKEAEQWMLEALSRNDEIGILAAQLFIQQESFDEEVLETIILSCGESDNGVIRQWGELFAYKYRGVPLSYSTFW